MRFFTSIPFFISLILIAIGAAFAFSPLKTVEESSVGMHEFVIQSPIRRVRKILVRTNAVKRIVAMADAEMLDQEWLKLNFEIDRPILKRDWHVDGEGQIIVRTNNSYIGSHDITLRQIVDIYPEKLSSVNSLLNPVGPIRAYASTLTLTPDENGNAKIAMTLDLKIKTTGSWVTSRFVRSGIKASAMDSLLAQEATIRAIVEEHADEILILPSNH